MPTRLLVIVTALVMAAGMALPASAHRMDDSWSVGSELWGFCSANRNGGWTMAIQAALKTHGINIGSGGPYNNGVDGWWGSLTHEGVRTWQANHGIGVDGCVGPQTWNQNMAALNFHRFFIGSFGNEKFYVISNHFPSGHSSYRESRYMTDPDGRVEIRYAGTNDAAFPGQSCRAIDHTTFTTVAC